MRGKRWHWFVLVMILAALLLGGCGDDDDTTDGDVSDGDVTDGDTTDGDVTDGDVTDGDTTDGDVTDGDVTDGDVTDGDVTDGDTTDGDVTDGDVTDGDVTDGDVTDGDVTDGDVTDGDVTDGDTPEDIGLNKRSSECGGFVDGTKGAREDEDPYCGDERLLWSVDAETGTISFTNVDVWLNCCGEHNITVTYEDDVFVITEIDDPEPGGGRCDCMCLFDFAVDMPGVDADNIDVRIDRFETDVSEAPHTVWQGTLDLTQTSGDEMIEERVGWCSDPEDLGTNTAFSECGGFPTGRAEEPVDCGDEMLSWVFDSETGTVQFVNSDIWINCCGDHAISIFYIDGTYLLAEVDNPLPEGGRCHCMCLFDFAIDLPGISESVIDVKITRDITDMEQPLQNVWEGSIDLSAGAGEIMIQENVGYCD